MTRARELETTRMRNTWRALVLVFVALSAGAVVWALRMPRPGRAADGEPGPVPPPAHTLRLGIIPERDIFAQRQRYRALADYLAARLGRPVEIQAVNSYEAVLQDLRDRKVEGAFLGSLVATMAVDQQGARVVAKPELLGGGSTYRGVIFVPDGSPVRKLEDLRGKRVAGLRLTMAGHLFPMYEFDRAGLSAEGASTAEAASGTVSATAAGAPRFVWVGTHDDVVREVFAGRADAGAAKNLRLDDFERTHPQYKVRRLALSHPAPEGALLMRGDVPAAEVDALAAALLGMHADPEGAKALQRFGAVRFLPCLADEYRPVRAMIEALGAAWTRSLETPPRPRPTLTIYPLTRPTSAPGRAASSPVAPPAVPPPAPEAVLPNSPPPSRAPQP